MDDCMRPAALPAMTPAEDAAPDRPATPADERIIQSAASVPPRGAAAGAGEGEDGAAGITPPLRLCAPAASAAAPADDRGAAASAGAEPDDAGRIEERRRRAREKKKRQRAAMSEEKRQAIRAADAKSKRAAYANRNEEQKAADRKRGAAHKRKAHRSRPFIGVDGEGAGKNAAGQQNLILLNAEGEGFSSSLHKGIGACGHISSIEAFEWILSLPGRGEAILIAFYFGWDVTQILRDIGSGAVKDLFKPNNYGPGGTRYWTEWMSWR